MEDNITEQLINEITSARENTKTAGDKQAKKEEKHEELVVCPCCGKPTLKKPIQPGGELLDHFMACMVTGTPYTRTYDLYKDKLHIKVSQVTQALSNMVELAVTQLQSYKDIVAGYDNKIAAIAEAIRVYACVESVIVDAVGGKTFMPAEAVRRCCAELSAASYKEATGETTADAIAKLLDAHHALLTNTTIMSAIPQNMLMSVVQLHNHIYSIMMDAGFDENFWSRIKLA